MQAEMTELLASFKEKFELEAPEIISEEEILAALQMRVGQLLERNPEEFFQMLYMIDIPEHKLQAVLKEADPIASLARTIYNRQLQKVKSRLHYRTAGSNEVDDDLKW